MSSRWFKLVALLALVVALLPVGSVFADNNDPHAVEFKGVVESLPNTAGWIGAWQVGGRTVNVSATTRIEQERGTIAVGVMVEVKGTAGSNGAVDATQIEVKRGMPGGTQRPVELKGVVQSLPSTADWIGDWTVAGKTIHVTSATRIERHAVAIAVGAYVEVKGIGQTDGSINASKIEVKSHR